MPIRVLVVEDSITVRKRIVEVLQGDPEFQVVAEAEDGRAAIELCLEHQPDVVTMDIMLPKLSGLAATEYIMAHRPTPILVVSASFNRGEVFMTYDALSAGAVDALEKPSGNEPPGEWELRFKSALRIVARVRVITHPRARLQGLSGAGGRSAPTAQRAHAGEARRLSLLALGASTGGPQALVTVLRDLPDECTLPVLVVMHIGAAFAVSLADWMGGQLRRPVRFALTGEALETLSGQILLAPPDRHLSVVRGRLLLSDGAERHSCRPSVDVLFESLAREGAAGVMACLLTGMGRDGAQGLLALRRAGARTIAQDEATCIVYGMPREAALLGAAEQILPLGEIGRALFPRGAIATEPPAPR
jgi:two-component system, chemotaxis family, protein-glutamate methylesterase/glutaminase